jgi:tetratricopeptide (TPR) repeat protein
MNLLKFLNMTIAICFTTIFANEGKGQAKSIDTIPNGSYDNFKNQSSYFGSYVIIRSNASGNILHEHNVVNGKCLECYDNLTLKADSCYNKINYSDAAVWYNAAFRLNGNNGKVKHRLNAACSLIKLNDYDSAFENLNKVVFGAKFRNLTEMTSKNCYKSRYKDERWKKLIDGINKNLDDVEQRIRNESHFDQ